MSSSDSEIDGPEIDIESILGDEFLHYNQIFEDDFVHFNQVSEELEPCIG